MVKLLVVKLKQVVSLYLSFLGKICKMTFYMVPLSLIFTRFCKEMRIASVLSSSFFCLIFWNYLLIPTKSGKNVNCWLGREDEQIRAPAPLALCNGYLMMPVVIYSKVYCCVQYEVFIQQMLFLSLNSTGVWLWTPV